MRFIALVLLLTSCCCPQKSKEQKEADQAAAASASAQRAAKKAELAENRKRCGDRFATSEWEDTCRDLVRKRLFQPSSAEFSYLMSVARDEDPKLCRQFYSSTVESKNAFGATIEHRFRCSFDTKKNRVTLDYIGMN
ncbi:MAG: hypothetical protein WC565_04780 [Parcubacteria group bacterium]